MSAVIPAEAGFLLDQSASLEADWDTFCAIENEVGKAESEGLEARWRCGRLLTRYESKRGSRGSSLAAAIRKLSGEFGLDERELYYRRQFAETYPTEEEFRTAVQNLRSWTELRDSLGKRASNYAKNAGGAHEGTDASNSDAFGERWKLLLGDFRERLNDLPDGSVNLICTDPPYPEEYLPLWNALGHQAARLLTRGGVLVARCGHLYLPKVLNSLSEHLQYGWLYAEPLPGSNVRFRGRKIAVAWQPWVAFSKGPWPSGTTQWHPDLLEESPRTKARYVWEQKPSVAAELIATHTSPGNDVLDPFAGSGAYGEAALGVGCRWIGVEIDPVGHARATERLTALS